MWWWIPVALASTPPRVHVDRRGRTIYLLDERGAVIHQEAVGIGRGGLTTKTSMADFITPTGSFTVDLVVGEAERHNAIAPALRSRWADDPIYGPLVDPADGLRTLFANMSSLDFDRDGQADRAYGVAYVGLHAEDAVTGPKMRQYHGTPYWYSIALHGTPSRDTLGAARSGGCVHVSAKLLTRLIDEGQLAVGQTVTIADAPPPRP